MFFRAWAVVVGIQNEDTANVVALIHRFRFFSVDEFGEYLSCHARRGKTNSTRMDLTRMT